MPLIAYESYNPKTETLAIIEQANQILGEYSAQGFSLTLRQLYYQFIARDLFPESYINSSGTKNNQQSYNKLGDIVVKARDAGLIDWDMIVDRGRGSESRPHWDGPKDFVELVSPQYNRDVWERQSQRVEVWVEKDALSDVVARACRPLDVPYTACKGYMSASAIWDAAYNRMRRNHEQFGQTTLVLHLGDHDPSGIDMSRDVEERLQQYAGCDRSSEPFITVQRIALTMSQVREYNPPPNFAKDTDSRYSDYLNVYGEESWELDALEPQVIVDLITRHVQQNTRNPVQMRRDRQRESDERATLVKIADHWPAVRDFLDTLPDAVETATDQEDTDEEESEDAEDE